MEDYTAGRKSGSAGTSSLFGGATQQPQQQSVFGSTVGSTFGQSKPVSFGGIPTKSFIFHINKDHHLIFIKLPSLHNILLPLGILKIHILLYPVNDY